MDESIVNRDRRHQLRTSEHKECYVIVVLTSSMHDIETPAPVSTLSLVYRTNNLMFSSTSRYVQLFRSCGLTSGRNSQPSWKNLSCRNFSIFNEGHFFLHLFIAGLFFVTPPPHSAKSRRYYCHSSIGNNQIMIGVDWCKKVHQYVVENK